MKLCSKIFAIAILAFTTYAMVGCAAPNGYSYQNISVSLAWSCSDCGDGEWVSPQPVPNYETLLVPASSGVGEIGCVLFGATVNNAPPNVTWNLYPTPNLYQTGLPTGSGAEPGEAYPSIGTLSESTGLTSYYCNDGVPTYTGNSLAQANSMGIPQGDVLMTLSVPADPSNPSAVFTRGEMLQIYNTTTGNVGVHLTPYSSSAPTPAASVVHNGGSMQFTGYAVGDIPCWPPSTGATTCNSMTTLNLGTVIPPIYFTDNQVDWAIAYYNSSNAISGTTNACTFPNAAAATPTAIAALPAICAAEGYIVIGSTSATGVVSATYYAPATVPASTATSGTPIVVLQSDASTSNTASAYINIQ